MRNIEYVQQQQQQQHNNNIQTARTYCTGEEESDQKKNITGVNQW